MAGDKPRICVALTENNAEIMKSAEPYADLFEVRIDCIGDGWPRLVETLKKPWIATNRRREEGGRWTGSESSRLTTLLAALEYKPEMVDIELQTPDMPELIQDVKKRAKVIVSYHDYESTPSLDQLRYLVVRMQDAGADVCKLVTMARQFEDNIRVLQLTHEFREKNIVCFAMGPEGRLSRVLAPLAGACFTFASSGQGNESAPGQVTAVELRNLYEIINHDR